MEGNTHGKMAGHHRTTNARSGPGGRHCPCCGPAPATYKVYRRAAKRGKPGKAWAREVWV